MVAFSGVSRVNRSCTNPWQVNLAAILLGGVAAALALCLISGTPKARLGGIGKGPIRILIVPEESGKMGVVSQSSFARVGLISDLQSILKEIRIIYGDVSTRVEVYFSDGTYRLKRPLELGAAEGGFQTELILKATEAARPIISGAQLVHTDHFGRGDGWGRDGRTVRLSLPANGVFEYGEIGARGYNRPSGPFHGELFANGRRLPLARWPNVGWATTSDSATLIKSDGVPFKETEALPTSLEEAKDVWALGYWTQDWAAEHLPLKSVSLAPARLNFVDPRKIGSGRRFLLYNARALIDQPGEWYLDRSTGTLDVRLTAPLREKLEFSTVDTLLRVKGASNITIDGLTFEMARGNAIVVEDSSNVQFMNCTVRNAGGAAVLMSGRSSGLERCSIHDIGDTAVRLTGGDRRSLDAGGLFVRDSEIHDFGRWKRTYTAGVELWGVGHQVVRNRIYSAPHTGVIVRGNDHRIDGNLFYKLLDETGDAGVIYQFGDWAARGTLFRGNTICNIRQPQWLGVGVYLDLLASGWAIIENRFLDVDHSILINGGSDNLIASNIIVGGTVPIYLDPIAETWMRRAFDDPSWYLLGPMRDVPHQSAPFDLRYPGLAVGFLGNPRLPKRNVIQNNRIIGKELGSFKGDVRDWQIIRDNDVEPTLDEVELRRTFAPECFS